MTRAWLDVGRGSRRLSGGDGGRGWTGTLASPPPVKKSKSMLQLNMTKIDIPVIPHECTGAGCCGCLIAEVTEDNDIHLICNECGQCLGVIAAAVWDALLSFYQPTE